MRLFVCQRQELDSQLREFVVDGLSWPVLAQESGQEIRIFSSRCPHEDVSLSGGRVTDDLLSCPGHGYRFSLSDGRCLHDPSLQMRRFRSHVLGSQVFLLLP